METRPMLLGMNNPLSDHPGFALYPDPVNCSGWRLWKMMEETCGATKREYLDAFERRNLLVGTWHDREAIPAAERFLEEVGGSGRTIVALGAKLRDLFSLGKLERLYPQNLHGCTWYTLPHPSGRCYWYNDDYNRRRAGRLLARLSKED